MYIYRENTYKSATNSGQRTLTREGNLRPPPQWLKLPNNQGDKKQRDYFMLLTEASAKMFLMIWGGKNITNFWWSLFKRMN